MCVLFWGCVGCTVWLSKSRATTHRYYSNGQPIRRVEGHVVSYPYPAQSHSAPQPHPQNTQTQAVFSEPQQVSLPEATLHQGDAPPGYEEAIRMKSVVIDGDQNT